MNPEPQPRFTRQQWDALNEEEQRALDAVCTCLHGGPLPRGDELTSSFLSATLNLLRPTDDADLPDETNEGGNVLQKKFHAIYHAGISLAETVLNRQGKKPAQDFNFLLVVETDSHGTTHVVITDWDAPCRYLHEWTEALEFADLKAIATKVLAVRNTLANAVLNPHRIYVAVEGGLLKEAHDIPRGCKVVCVDYDVEHLPVERLEISPLDGQACTLTTFTP